MGEFLKAVGFVFCCILASTAIVLTIYSVITLHKRNTMVLCMQNQTILEQEMCKLEFADKFVIEVK